MAATARGCQAATRFESHAEHSGWTGSGERQAAAAVAAAGEALAHLRFELGDEEFAELSVAAAQAGLAKGAYAAQAVLAAARSGASPGEFPLREALGEFIRAAGLVRRIGVNLNQAVTKLNATGQRSGDLLPVRGGEHPPGAAPRPGRRGSAETDPAMIGKVSPHGQRVTGLIYYLFGPGRQAEHTDPYIVAGWRHPAELEPPLREDGRRDFRDLAGLLQQPHAALGPRGSPRPVWHCSVHAAPEDRILSDDEWAQVACEIMHRTGLAPYGQEDDAVRRWGFAGFHAARGLGRRRRMGSWIRVSMRRRWLRLAAGCAMSWARSPISAVGLACRSRTT